MTRQFLIAGNPPEANSDRHHRPLRRGGSPVPDEGAFALSVAQSELLLAQQLHPTVPISIAQYTDLHGPLDHGLLQHCLQRASRELQ